MNNEDVMNALQRWARDEAQIDPHPQVFRCRYYDECNHSVGEKLWRERGCQMSYVSRRYGSSPDAFRLVLVGMDHGDPGGDDFEGWRDRLDTGFPSRPVTAANG
jgi:hypothetical protein